MLRVSASVGALVAMVLLLAACGGSDETAPAQSPTAADDAFVVHLARNHQTGLALARTAATDADAASVRKLARGIAKRREALMPAIMERAAKVPEQASPADLDVPEAQAADAITPDALEGARPVDPAFLTLMAEHNRGTLALAKAELSRGSDPAVKALAERIASTAAGELAELSDELAALAAQS